MSPVKQRGGRKHQEFVPFLNLNCELDLNDLASKRWCKTILAKYEERIEGKRENQFPYFSKIISSSEIYNISPPYFSIMSNDQNPARRQPLPDLNATSKDEIQFLLPLVLGVALGIFGNIFVSAIFELLRNMDGGVISNNILIGIIIISLGIISLPIYTVYHNMLLMSRRKWGSTICISGTQKYTIGDTFKISGTCLSQQNNVTLKLYMESQFRENQLIHPIHEFTAPIEEDYQYHSGMNTSGLAPGLYRLIAINNDNGAYSTVSLTLVDSAVQ